MRLTELVKTYRGERNPEIKGLTQDSRQVHEGWLFAALPGVKVDGRRFVDDAIQQGAVAVLVSQDADLPESVGNVPVIADENPRLRLSLMASMLHAPQPDIVVAVTGTNGKTSTVHFAQQLWQALDVPAVSLGTLGVHGAGIERAGSLTTPDPVSLHAALSGLAESGINHMSMEASSHGLHQYRLDGVRVSAAGFTNISRDHLDYHETMESYLAAKMRLFTDITLPGGTAVLNADADQYDTFCNEIEKRDLVCFSYGWKGQDIHLLERSPIPEGQRLKLEVLGRSYELVLPLVGEFQVMNAFCALGLVIAEAPDNEARTAQLVEALADLQPVPGRLEVVSGHPAGATVCVDYAHTPDALETVLKALRPHTAGRLFCIVGCGGDRDAGKRPMMARIAADLSDVAVITDDNPRTEDPAQIRADMMAGAPDAKEIGSRGEAIAWAVNELTAGDLLLVAGKGHEQGQIIGVRVEPFDDRQEVRNVMGSLGGICEGICEGI